MNSRSPSGALSAVVVAFVTMFYVAVHGATVLGMDTREMLGKSQLVFEGQVVSSQSR